MLLRLLEVLNLSSVACVSAGKIKKIKFMENLRGNYNNPKTPTIKFFEGNAVPIHNRFHTPVPLSPVFDPYELSENFNTPNPLSPLVQRLRSGSSVPFDGSGGGSRSSGTRGGFGSPLSSIENLLTQPLGSPITVFKTPVKVEEDVIVMDGFPVNPKGGSSRPRGTVPSDPGLGQRREPCRVWQQYRSCRFGHSCQYAHGVQELHPPAPKNYKSEMCRSIINSGTCPYGPRCRYFHPQPQNQVNPAVQSPAPRAEAAIPPQDQVNPVVQSPASRAEVAIPPQDQVNPAVQSPASRAEVAIPVSTPTVVKDPASGGNSSTSATASTATASGNNDWSPADDGIETSLPGKAPVVDVNAHIQTALYGPSGRKRLPIFGEICPEPEPEIDPKPE
ncbi:mRNA decay activator protein ZFP36-like isoform X2 [Ipomoea triloba]|uniref:mRNA decay activator protein ZFP36-like isoform X2 n=1 Tax=Ipomoea triloba TaxID=35885 RepID=UPI00125E1907|nr:mRNA decay activator protein ZFP36-like isoform X2 [Ipomoea triloba]